MKSPQTNTIPELPPRVARILRQIATLAGSGLERMYAESLVEAENQIFALAERATNPARQGELLDVCRRLREHRAASQSQFRARIEQHLANFKSEPHTDEEKSDVPTLGSLRLVEETEVNEETAIRTLMGRIESRGGLPLRLLAQRFGVLAASPAFDSEQVPIGPQRVCDALRHAVSLLDCPLEFRLQFYRAFELIALQKYGECIAAVDKLVEQEGVLPGMTQVPYRLRQTGSRDAPGADAQDFDAANDAAPATGGRSGGPARQRMGGGGFAGGGHPGGGHGGAGQYAGGGGHGGGAGSGHAGGYGGHAGGPPGSGAASGDAQPVTGVSGVAASGPHGGPMSGASSPYQTYALDGDQHNAYTAWMSSTAGAHAISGSEIEQADRAELERLFSLRHVARSMGADGDAASGVAGAAMLAVGDIDEGLARLQQDVSGTALTLADVRHNLLAQSRQQHGKPMQLAQSDEDIFELLEILFRTLMQEIRQDSPVAGLLRMLQIPILRTALKDRTLLVKRSHPARELLSIVSEFGARWLHDQDLDPSVIAPLQQSVENITKQFDGDAEVIAENVEQLKTTLDSQVRKSEMVEKRNVEAMRGREKLEVAKQRSAALMAELLDGKQLPKFTQALMQQAWADVLTLTLLQHGEESEAWKKLHQASIDIVGACTGQTVFVSKDLQDYVAQSLELVGYHGEEAQTIAQRLTSSTNDEDDPASRTEITIKLKARTRLGEDAAKARAPELTPRTPAEEERYQQLLELPFGTWIEFVTNQQGDVVRRRLSWYSRNTGHALFVNQRGQRVGEQTLDSLSRLLANDQARIVTVDKGRILDRAWDAALKFLRDITAKPTSDPSLAGASA